MTIMFLILEKVDASSMLVILILLDAILQSLVKINLLLTMHLKLAGCIILTVCL